MTRYHTTSINDDVDGIKAISLRELLKEDNQNNARLNIKYKVPDGKKDPLTSGYNKKLSITDENDRTIKFTSCEIDWNNDNKSIISEANSYGKNRISRN